MIDCGVSFAAIGKAIYKVDYLLITHVHSDHLKLPTLTKIRKSFPHIKIIGNYEVAYKVKLDIITADLAPITLGDWTVTPFPCVHDVVCQGFVLDKDERKIIYATDTATLDNAPKQKYDWFFLESNHDEKILSQLQGQKNKYGYDVWEGALRHLSTQASKTFYYLNRRDRESPYIELHKSERFY